MLNWFLRIYTFSGDKRKFQKNKKTKVFVDFFTSRLVNFELPPGVYEMIDIESTVNDLVKINVVTDDITEKTSV